MIERQHVVGQSAGGVIGHNARIGVLAVAVAHGEGGLLHLARRPLHLAEDRVSGDQLLEAGVHDGGKCDDQGQVEDGP